MTQEDKNLLFKDLCGRLPYGVKGKYQYSKDESLRKIPIVYRYLEYNGIVITGDVKPYLFPLSSMSEEQKKEYCNLQDIFLCSSQYPVTDAYELFDWLNANHFDYRGLIEKGLAIDCTNLNIY